jgi:hypothetical protein
MKSLSIATLFIVTTGAAAFSHQQQRVATSSSTSLQAQPTNKNWWAPAVTAAIGWSLASQVALAAQGANSLDFLKPDEPTPTMSLDFSMPKYDGDTSGKSAVGFGLGNAVRLNSQDTASTLTDPGANEKEKQAASMRKAEENRVLRVATEKAAKKERELEYQQREAEKKLEKAERLKNIWN